MTWRGDRRNPIFEDDHDRELFLAVVEEALTSFDAKGLAYRLMDNQFHNVLKARQPSLSRLMRHINGVYTRARTRRHEKTGPLQGRIG